MTEPRPIPDRPESDTDEAWGDRPAYDEREPDDDSRRLLDERPPHYDR